MEPLLACCTVIREYGDIQEFYELTLLDDTKSIQQKTAETIRIANKWESSEGPISYNNEPINAADNEHVNA
uniref:Uncharacterized protein n=1 Tax=Rhodnius prolixus TaxID=13249 RepID=T1HRZ5_RHOPR